MKKEISKKEAINQIEKFFEEIKNKRPKEIKKIKKLAMNNKIRIKDKRKLFCKYCLTPFNESKIRIRDSKKIITCNKCNKISRYLIKN